MAALTMLTAIAALVLASSLPAAAQTVVVEGADGNVWDPDEIEIAAGTVVTFDMTGGDAGHNGYIENEEIVPFVPIGQSADYTFEEEGEFEVVCTLHPGMDMIVTVSGEGEDLADESEDDAPEDEAPEDEAPEDEDAEEDADAEEPADDPAAEDDAGDEELAAADVDPDEGGGDTVLLVSVIVAVVLMVASFGLIRRQTG